MENRTILQQIEFLERNLDDQAELIRKMARGMRFAFHELEKEVPDLDLAKDHLATHYIGGPLELMKAVGARGARKR